MAVVKLKLITVTGHKEDYDAVLRQCLQEPMFHIENAADVIPNMHNVIAFNEANPYTTFLTQITNLASNAGIHLHSSLPSATDAALTDVQPTLQKLDDLRVTLLQMQTEYTQLVEARDNFKNILYDDERMIEHLDHIGNINVDFDKLFSFEFFKIRFGHMPRESYDTLNLYTNDLDNLFFMASSVGKREVWGVYFTPRTKGDRIDSLFASLHFERVRISPKAHGTPTQAREQVLEEIQTTKLLLVEQQKKLDAYKAKITPELARYSYILQQLNKIFDIRRKAIYTANGFTLAGWIPDKQTAPFTKALEQFSSVSYTVESPTSVDHITPPTKLKNNRFIKPFEEFVTMYGLPSYNEIDPTPFVALTYILFFGMMFGDIGQGAVIVLAGLFLGFVKKMYLGKILAMVGCSSMIFGCIYGSVFGNEHLLPGFKPMENINTVLLLAVAVGAVIITIAMVFNVINAIRQKNIEKLLFSQNGIAGFLFYWGVILLVLVGMKFISPVVPVAILIILVVLSIVAIFLREPLTKLLEHRKDWIPQNKMEFVLENFFELFEVVLSYLTNTISFIRIGAFALNHVGMMLVVFLLAQGTNGSNNPIVLIIGNLFVIGFEGMIVCIQALRLEFYEIFGRFFEGDGRPFESISDVESKQ